MNALFLVHNLPDRGSYFRALEIARRVALRGHHVQFAYIGNDKKYRPVYTPVPPDEPPIRPPSEGDPRSTREFVSPGADSRFVWAEMPYFTLFNDRQEGWSFFDNGFRMRDAWRGRWDLVYGFSHKPDVVLPALAAKARGARLVMDWSDWWGGREGLYRHCVVGANAYQSMPGPLRWGRRAVFGIEEIAEPHVYRAADAVTLIGEEFLRHPRAPKNLRQKSLVLHSGAPLHEIQPVSTSEARRRVGFQVPQGHVVLGYVANFNADERLLMETFARVCQARPDIHLLIVGADLEKATPEVHHATRGRVHHQGRQPFSRIGDFLGAADILLLPLTNVALNRARYPHKLSDYVAAGRPIIACDVGETGRLLRKYDFGHLAQPNADDFARQILALAGSSENWPALATATRQAAEQHFDWDKLCDKLFGFLHDQTGLKI